MLNNFLLQLNVSYPATGCQKLFEVDDEKKLHIFYEKRMGHEVEVDTLGDEWKGYVVRIAGGNDKQGFPMKQGVLTNSKLIYYSLYSCYNLTKVKTNKSSFRIVSFVACQITKRGMYSRSFSQMAHCQINFTYTCSLCFLLPFFLHNAMYIK